MLTESTAPTCPVTRPDVEPPVASDTARTSDGPDAPLSLTALRVAASAFDLVPATPRRAWMDATSERFANRCLPMLIANQAGWHVIPRHDVRARWDGTNAITGITVDAPDFSDFTPAVSHFGHGVLTWTLPWLFRTPPGWDLLVRGPANLPVSGAYPLEGVVETDWSPYTFTMNWLLTDPGREVAFPAGQPVCLLVPQRRGALERFAPTELPIEGHRAEQQAFTVWRESRDEFSRDLQVPGTAAHERGWQRDYFIADDPAARAAGHRRRLRLRPFRSFTRTTT